MVLERFIERLRGGPDPELEAAQGRFLRAFAPYKEAIDRGIIELPYEVAPVIEGSTKPDYDSSESLGTAGATTELRGPLVIQAGGINLRSRKPKLAPEISCVYTSSGSRTHINRVGYRWDYRREVVEVGRNTDGALDVGEVYRLFTYANREHEPQRITKPSDKIDVLGRVSLMLEVHIPDIPQGLLLT